MTVAGMAITLKIKTWINKQQVYADVEIPTGWETNHSKAK